MLRLRRSCQALAIAMLAVAVFASNAGAPHAQGGQTAEEVYHNHISGPIIQTKCVNCHVQGGLSGHTRLVFVRRSAEVDYESLNLQTFQDFLAEVDEEGGGGYVLLKIQGALGHGGLEQVPSGSADFANMERFVALLGEELAPRSFLTVETLFDTVIMASPRKTLRRAALIFAGRIPTDEEYAAVEDGDESALRTAIRGLMEGPQFHEFLIRASNDRLLTDRWQGDGINYHSFVDFIREHYRRKKAAHESGDERVWHEYGRWMDQVGHGSRRAPLELIAHVAENDLPYTEILTADYIMANPMAAAAYGASTRFDDPTDPFEFRPSRIVSYYREGAGSRFDYDPVIGAIRVIDPGPLITDYPHAGILNTTAFLQRYPSTATNRNRARARWTYYHFLGVDVEKSASRTTDPVALADTNNPTMHNLNCTVCHSVLDPVAGAFQNYNDDGFYKSNWGGLDSLDEFYKHAPPGGQDVTVDAFSWNDRRTFSVSGWLPGGESAVGLQVILPPDQDHSGWTPHLGIDYLAIRRSDGTLVERYELEEVVADRDELTWEGEHCGHPISSGGKGDKDSYRLWECALAIPVEVSESGDYSIEVVAWVLAYGEYDPDAGATLRIWVPAYFYEQGDTWYRDMRIPGFAGGVTPNSDNSVQWLARQIVGDPRFAEAAIKFWWPAIMGSEVAEFPEEAADADFEGRLLAANAQHAEMVRLAQGFRDGFPGSPYTYNLKDLLVEIVLSAWFRADALTDTDPVRRVALRDAGAWRLLTPEELARKTAAVTGFHWGRRIRTDCLACDRGVPNALTDEYRLLYGGIDSDGITERLRDMTSVMAGVAKSHAVQVSCPAVMREVYLLPDAERRLFAGIDRDVTPVSEFSDTFEITAASRLEMGTFSLQGHLTAGEKTVALAFLNDYWDERGDRNVLLDRLTVRQGSTTVYRYEMENLEHPADCHHVEQNAFHLSGSGSACVLAVPVDIPANGVYQIEVSAWATHAGDELPKLNVTVESDTRSSAGAAAIRNKLVELHDKLLGVQVSSDSPDVEAAYRLFVDIMHRGREARDDGFDIWYCHFQNDIFFFDGILDDAVVQHENEDGVRWHELDWDRIHDFLDGIDFSDLRHTAQAWVAVLAAMMMDDRYLYLQ